MPAAIAIYLRAITTIVITTARATNPSEPPRAIEQKKANETILSDSEKANILSKIKVC